MSDATTLDGSFVGAHVPSGADRSYLIVREPGRTRVVDLDDGAEVVFGRSSSCTVQLDDGKASREHARFVRRGDVVEMIDLGSRNGTQLNDELVAGATRRVRSGDVVRIGKVEILVAETAAMTSVRAGSRLALELGRLLDERGAAVLLQIAAGGPELHALASLLGRVAVIERQADDRYACIVESRQQADELIAEAKRIAPRAAVTLAQAPDDGADLEALLRHANPAGKAPARPQPASPPGVVVADAAMVRVFELVRKVAAAPTTVLVLGDTGVGKEVIAEQIHRLSPRAAGPFMRINCGSLPETLIESELFGHEKGAFTGADRRKLGYVESAHGGTLFLDEIGELTPAMQTRLLRVLENRRFTRVGGREEIEADVRVVAATNRNLEEEAKAGHFRRDLYFRLSAFVIRVPPLRERAGELELLAQLFVRQLARRMNLAAPA
ncbi:MAG TPA: sigma-54-dependent Fis family transcriptional regulator, partial [Polyangia bacterium]|nr:sigma-54-dependent Fis family transcriptional regulator [Polyangia bacterium]